MAAERKVSGERRPVIGVGVVVMLNRRVLLIRRARPPLAGQWSLPGGRQEWGETVEEAARRELREETNLRAGSLHLLDVVDAVLRDAGGTGKVTSHFTLIDFWTEVTEEAAEAARAGGDAAELRWATEEEVDLLVDWRETRHACRLALARRDAATGRNDA